MSGATRVVPTVGELNNSLETGRRIIKSKKNSANPHRKRVIQPKNIFHPSNTPNIYTNQRFLNENKRISHRQQQQQRSNSNAGSFFSDLRERISCPSASIENMFIWCNRISSRHQNILILLIRLLTIMTLTGVIIGLTELGKKVLLGSSSLSSSRFIFGSGLSDKVYIQNEGEVISELYNLKWDWPVSVRNEEESFESIIHPADPTVRLNVPPFFYKGSLGGDGKLITPRIAQMIGSSNRNSFSSNPVDQKTIFVSIVSYRDWQCRYSIENLFHRAKFPQRIRVAVVDQLNFEQRDPSCDVPIHSCDKDSRQALCLYRDQIDVYELDASLAVGPMFARHIVNRMYRGEFFVLQIDSHVTFVQNWDANIIQQWYDTKNEMAILSTRLSDSQGAVDEKTGKALKTSRHIVCNSDFKSSSSLYFLQHKNQPELHASFNSGTPLLEPYWAAGFSFARGHFIMNVPYDPYLPLVFQGEEISMGMRAFTMGYDFYSPDNNVCFHTDSETVNERNEKFHNKKQFWEHVDKYRGVDKKSLMRLLGLINMSPSVDPALWNHIEENTYGLGKVRDTAKFFQCFGIHVQVRRTEHKLCDFVQSGMMHDSFTKHLRSNGMGIDYSKIFYRFHEKAMKD